MPYIIAAMNTTRSVARLEREIEAVRRALLALGPMHPGSISRQYQVCGHPGCRCMDPEHPRRHGPYHKLAYVHRGRPVCRFVRADCIGAVQQRLAVYKTFRKLMDRWIGLSIQRGALEFFSRPAAAKAKPASGTSARNSGKKPRRP
jgi:hypothetical protein